MLLIKVMRNSDACNMCAAILNQRSRVVFSVLYELINIKIIIEINGPGIIYYMYRNLLLHTSG